MAAFFYLVFTGGIMKTKNIAISERRAKEYAANPDIYQLKDRKTKLVLRYNRARNGGTWYYISYRNNTAQWLKIGSWPLLSATFVKKNIPNFELQGLTGEAQGVDYFETTKALLVWFRDRVALDSGLSHSRRATVKSTIDKRLIKYVGKLKPDELNKKIIEERIVEPMLKEGREAGTIKLVFATLKRAFNSAEEMELITTNKLSKITLNSFQIKQPKPRENKLNPALLSDLLSNINNSKLNTGTALVKLMLFHGTRVNETVKAKWSDINLKRGYWLLPALDTKNGKGHSIPITEAAYQFLSDWHNELFINQKYRGNYLFPKSIRTDKGDKHISINKAHELIKEISLGNWTAHHTRKCCASNWLNSGEDYIIIKLILNHHISALDSAYMQGEAIERKRDLLSRWHFFLNELNNEIIPR